MGFVAVLDNLRKYTVLCCLIVVLKTLIQEKARESAKFDVKCVSRNKKLSVLETGEKFRNF